MVVRKQFDIGERKGEFQYDGEEKARNGSSAGLGSTRLPTPIFLPGGVSAGNTKQSCQVSWLACLIEKLYNKFHGKDFKADFVMGAWEFQTLTLPASLYTPIFFSPSGLLILQLSVAHEIHLEYNITKSWSILHTCYDR